MSGAMQIEEFFDPSTWTISYLILDRKTRHCAILDSVLDYDPASGRTSTVQAQQLVDRVRQLDATLDWILETHAHADHLTAAPYLKQQLGGSIGIGEYIVDVQQVFGQLFNTGDNFARDGSQFDRLIQDGETLSIGSLSLRAIHTPGHTPACMTYVVTDASEQVAFVGDTLFMPDYGTARCDFPGGNARTLYQSIMKVLALPPATKLYMCHDYQPGGREMQFVSTVADQKSHNIHIGGDVSEAAFAMMRTERDATLDMPRLILPSVQVNMRAGYLPPRESNGIRYLRIPIDAL